MLSKCWLSETSSEWVRGAQFPHFGGEKRGVEGKVTDMEAGGQVVAARRL